MALDQFYHGNGRYDGYLIEYFKSVTCAFHAEYK